MGCCCNATYKKPSALIVAVINAGDLVSIDNATVWNDALEKACTNCNTTRQVFWQFAVNGRIMYELGMGELNAPFPIGVSTYNQIVANEEQIVAYLQGQGIPILDTDEIGVKIIAQNCNGLWGHSNVVTFDVAPCSGWETLELGNAVSLGFGCWETLETF
jgi:hypothetical protein